MLIFSYFYNLVFQFISFFPPSCPYNDNVLVFWERTSQSLPNNWSIQALPSYILLSKWEGGGHMYWKDIMAIWEKGLGKYRHPQRFHGYSFHHETCFLRRIQWRSLRKKGRHSLRIWWTTCITWWQLCSFWFSIEKKNHLCLRELSVLICNQIVMV